MILPSLVIAADWSCRWDGRWLVEAERSGNEYIISHPIPVGPPEHLVPSILQRLREGEVALLGLDFPIGLPQLYAKYRAIRSFKHWLETMPEAAWKQFATPSDEPTLEKPFGPKRSESGVLTKAQLAERLGLTVAGLYRRCDSSAGPPDPQSLFFTLGANQVGKAALHGWWSVIRPNLQGIKLWPFDGTLEELLASPGLVVVEIYPSAAGRIIALPRSAASRSGDTIRGKREPEYRLSEGVRNRIRVAAGQVGATFSSSAADWIERGFADSHDFDALVSLLGMLTAIRSNSDGELSAVTSESYVRSVEGWILGVSAAPTLRQEPSSTIDLEEEVCSSVVGFLAERFGGVPEDIRLPDSTERHQKAVDRAFRIREKQIVLEHTRIEAYPGRIQDDVVALAVGDALRSELGQDFLPGSKLDLMMPRGVKLSVKKAKAAAPSVAAWIRMVAATLELGSSRTVPRHLRREVLPSLGFEVTLYRWPSKQFRLRIRGPAPEDDSLLAERLRTAVKKKFPKLAAAAELCHATSVLVLEHRDVQLGNVFQIAVTLRKVLDQSDLPTPDVVLLFESDFWKVWTLRADGRWEDLDYLTEDDPP